MAEIPKMWEKTLIVYYFMFDACNLSTVVKSVKNMTQ